MESREELINFNIGIMPDYAQLQPLPSKEFVYDLIQREVGKNVIWPSCNYVLLKVYNPDKTMKIGSSDWERTEAYQKQYGHDTREAMILCWGPDAFLSRGDFPTGRPYNIGQKLIFLRYENSFVNVNNVQLCYLADNKLTLYVKDFKEIDTTHAMGK